jgi:hypothetical protein
MKNVIKITGIAVGSILLLLFLFLASIPLWFPVKDAKNLLVTQLAEKTGRQVEIKDLQFNVFKGIELKGFTIKEPPRYGKRDFIKDSSIVLRYNLFALLGMQLVIDRFELVSPYIEIVKDQEGNYNFSDIIDKVSGRSEAAKKKGKKPVPSPASAKAGTGSVIKNIIVTSVAVSNGNFAYADYSKSKPVSIKIEKFNFGMENMILAVVKPIGVNMDCTVIYNNFKIPVSLKSSVTADLKNRNIIMKIAPFMIGGINTSGSISLVDFTDIKGSLNSVSNTRQMLEVLPPDLGAKVKDMNVSIDLINDVDFTYINNKIVFNDILKMENGGFTYQKNKFVDKLKAKISVTSSYELSGTFNFLLAGSEVKIGAKGSRINDPEGSVYKIDIHSPKFAAEYLMAMFPKKDESSGSNKTVKKSSAGKGNKTKKKEKAKVTGVPGIYLTLNADSIFYKSVNIGKTTASISYAGGKVHSDISMVCYEGKINSDITMDINKETYSITAGTKNINVHQLIDDAISVIPKKDPKKKDPKKKDILDDIKDKVYGRMDLDAGFSGYTFDDPAHTIKGDGSFIVKDGKIAATETGKDLSAKVGVAFLAKEMPFDVMGADFNMAKGVINIKNFRVLNGVNGEKGDMRIKGAGYVTVDRALDFKVETDVNPQEAKQVEEYFARNLGIRDISFAYNKDGWLPFDFRIYNNLENKKYDYSQKRMMDNVSRNLTKKVQDQGKQYLEKNGKELLKNLFGK